MTQTQPLVDDVEAGPVEAKSLSQKGTVWIVFTVFVTFRAADRVFLKDIGNSLQNPTYNLIWANILWPLAIQLMTICMLLGYIAVQRYQGNMRYTWRFFLPGSDMASSRGAIPLYQLALFSLGDQLNAAISAPPTPFVALPVQSVMTNSVIMWMAIIGFFWIKARFSQVHIIGITLVLMSILVQISQKLTSNDCSATGMMSGMCFASYKNQLGQFIGLDTSQMAIWYGMFFVSTLPAAAGNIYKQKILQGNDVDVWYAAWWSGNFQVVWGWLCVPLLWVPLPGQETLAPGQTFQAVLDTLSCFAGNVPHPGDETCASSPPAWVWVILYLCFNITFNICLLYLTKHMSAMWAQVATVLCLNLCSIFSQFHFLMGDSAQLMSLNDWLGLVLASIALWVYNLEPEKTANGDNMQLATGSFVADGAANLIEKIAGSSTAGGSIAGSFRKQAAHKDVALG